MQLKEAMTADVRAIAPSASLKEAALIMRDRGVGIIPVIENDQTIGVITDRDIAIRAVADCCDPASTRVSEVMTREVISAYDDIDLHDAIRQMEVRRVGRLIVKNRAGRLVGILSASDAALLSDDKESSELARTLAWEHRKQMHPPVARS